jgi:hypothetical protein
LEYKKIYGKVKRGSGGRIKMGVDLKQCYRTEYLRIISKILRSNQNTIKT